MVEHEKATSANGGRAVSSSTATMSPYRDAKSYPVAGRPERPFPRESIAITRKYRERYGMLFFHRRLCTAGFEGGWKNRSCPPRPVTW